MASPGQLAAMAKARAARAAKRNGTATNGAAVAANLPADLATVAARVEVLWTERALQIDKQRSREPYNIFYRCKECGTIVEEVAPQFLLELGRMPKCPNPIHNGSLTEMDH